ncbi:MAG: uridine kinase [Halobacteriovoraceae bacterium]|nr:uridine kinase [Halobacteriovoraceae bacterium]
MYTLGITGGSGSGKTTFSQKILKRLPKDSASVLSMDSYYLTEQPKACLTPKGKPNFDHPEAFDWPLLRAHLKLLKEGHTIQCPTYCFKTYRRLEEYTEIQAKPVIILEGIFTLIDPEIRKLLNLKCFLFVDADIRFTRRLHRDIQDRGRSLNSVMEQYYETVRPMYQKYLEPQKQYADIIIGEETDNAAIVVAARLKEILHEQAGIQPTL